MKYLPFASDIVGTFPAQKERALLSLITLQFRRSLYYQRVHVASRIRNPDWQEDAELKQDLKRYILQNLSRREILDFVSRDYAQYAWSLGTLSRRLAYFDIKYIEYNTDLKEVEAALQSELQGPGQLLGYRSMQRKIREQHQLAVPRNLVYDLMTEIDPDGLERRGSVGKRKHKRGAAGTFTSMGPNHTHSGDGHDKLMGFMNCTFPLAVYGLQDAYSGYILYLKLWTSNSDPKIIGRWYLQHLYESKVISNNLRLDKGTETGYMATIHSYLRQQGDAASNGTDAVHYGSSTSNKIERWWRELHNRLERYFKRQLMMLLERGHYDPANQTDRNLLAFIYIPVIQKEMNIFRETVWNSHRVRHQRDAQMPKGIPSHLYSFPEQYGAEDCGFPVTNQALDEVAEVSGVMAVGDDFLPCDVRRECERVIPSIENVEAVDAADTYLFLKANYREP